MGEFLLSQDSQSVVFLQDPKGYFIFNSREPIVINCDCGFGFSAHSHMQFQIWVCFEAWKCASANRKPKLLKPWKSCMGIACFEEILVIESVTVHGSSCVCMCHFTLLSPPVLTVFPTKPNSRIEHIWRPSSIFSCIKQAVQNHDTLHAFKSISTALKRKLWWPVSHCLLLALNRSFSQAILKWMKKNSTQNCCVELQMSLKPALVVGASWIAGQLSDSSAATSCHTCMLHADHPVKESVIQQQHCKLRTSSEFSSSSFRPLSHLCWVLRAHWGELVPCPNAVLELLASFLDSGDLLQNCACVVLEIATCLN